MLAIDGVSKWHIASICIIAFEVQADPGRDDGEENCAMYSKKDE